MPALVQDIRSQVARCREAKKLGSWHHRYSQENLQKQVTPNESVRSDQSDAAHG
ncbi:MAG: hypothetical protein L6R40_001162 [Gallowayella cf. fulva]|nr:MAG: hypothetical protein L6R40_001162 [Xanthomendoza cf. fulva]